MVIGDFDYTSNDTSSIAFWFKVIEHTGSTYKCVFSHGSYPDNNTCNIYIFGTSHSSFPKIQTCLKDPNAEPGKIHSTIDYSDDMWHLYVLTVSPGNINVYIDNLEPLSSASGGVNYNPTTDIFIGGPSDSDPYYYNGYVDEFRIYNRELSASDVSELYTLNQLAAPTITTQPQSQTIQENQNVEFSVGANGNPTPTFQWFENGSPLSGETNTLLTLTNVPSLYNGNYYYIVASNSQGTDTSDTATLGNSDILGFPALRRFT